MEKATARAYLKAIYSHEEEGNETTTLSIARILRVKPASVSEMLGKLAEEGYVKHLPYRGVSLTDTGRLEAKRSVRKQRIMETFLSKMLGLPEGEAIKQAEELHKSLSDEADEKLCMLMKRPMRSVRDKEIPHCGKKMSCESCLALGSKRA